MAMDEEKRKSEEGVKSKGEKGNDKWRGGMRSVRYYGP